MPEGLKTPTGEKVDLDQEFAQAMAAPESDEPLAPAPPKKDPDAPYGFRADGKPRVRPVGKTSHDKPRIAKTAQAPSVSPQAVAKQRTEGVKGVIQMVSVAPLMMAQRAKPDSPQQIAWMADTLTLTSNADAIAQAVTDTASVSPAFASVVDKLTNVGPYGALITVGLTVGAQLMANHGIGIGKALGGKDPNEIVAMAQAEQEKAPDEGSSS